MSATVQTLPASFEAPREFIGMARQFRSIVDAEDDAVMQAIPKIVAPFKARIRNNGVTFRSALLADTERQWREKLPTEGRLSLDIERTKSELFIREVRCSAGTFRFVSWLNGTREPDVGLQEIKLTTRPGHLKLIPCFWPASLYMPRPEGFSAALISAIRTSH
jgi:hypothetical protein